jgi:hypothetical protein
MTTLSKSGFAKIGALAILAMIATCTASCSSSETQSPAMNLPTMQVAPATGEPCQIDAIKMCQETSGGSAASPQPAPATMSYGPSNLPDSVEFQIPAGQAIKLMCYYDPQHTAVYRADATPEAALTQNSVDYMKKQGFCK